MSVDTAVKFEPHEQRVIDEVLELEKKIYKLSRFMISPIYLNMEDEDQDLLVDQLKNMKAYRRILNARIGRFVIAAKAE